MTEQKTALDFEALRRADEQNDVEALAGFYAEDAEMRLVSKDNPPARHSSCAAGSRSPSFYATSSTGT